MLCATLLRVPAVRRRRLSSHGDEALERWLREADGAVREARKGAQDILATLERSGARLVVMSDAEYPVGLCDLGDAPPLLFVRGSRVVPGGTAIVGTRTPSRGGAFLARALAGVVPPPVVSGLALGTDAAAHRGALEHGVPTIAYVGHGFGATYPSAHGALEQEIAEAGGAVATERLPGATATPWSLQRRDRLQAAHALATVLVESEMSGGAMHTMRYAGRLSRARFALEPRGNDARTAGNAAALRDGATPLPWGVAPASGAAAIRAALSDAVALQPRLR